MSSQLSHQVLGYAILKSVQHGSFPQSEDVASSSVPSTALPKLLEVIGKARDDTKNEIRAISSSAASDVDGWIAQARKLQDDIKRSQEAAHEIVRQAELGKKNTEKIQDAASKVSFLYSEISYNEGLVRAVEQLRDISTLLDSVQDAAVHGSISHALERLEDANAAFKQLGPFENTRVVGVLRSKSDQLRAAIVETVTESWNELIVIDTAEHRMSMKEEVRREDSGNINTIVEALIKLSLLDKFVARLGRDIDRIVLTPRLVIGVDQIVSAFEINGDDIRMQGHVSDMSVKAALEDTQRFSEYLSTRLPPSVAIPLSEKLVPVIASRLISNWLLRAVPLSMEGVHDFQETLSLVLGLAEFFDELEWSGQNRLRDWVDKSAEIWLARRKEAAIAKVRSLYPRGIREKKSVERVETQMVAKGDTVLDHADDQDEDWGADWGEEEDPAKEDAAPTAADVEEEDFSDAWGMDDVEEPQEHKETKPEQNGEAEDDGEAWGWGDEDETQPTPSESQSKPGEQHKPNGKAAAPQKHVAEKEVSLREMYTVTAIPDSIIETIIQVVSDVGTLNQPDLVKSAIAPQSGGLYAIPSLILAMYRATAATYYSKDDAGNMLIYNDCTRLADRLRKFLQEQAKIDKSSTLPQYLRPSLRLKLEDDVKAIESFGKRAYGREMESQRTIIRDMLDGAQGFAGCTAEPLASECDNAIAMTIDRINEVKRQWQNVLSHSALLQSIGSLISTALTKFISDVEDMSDIAEDESKKLHGYCVSLSSLSSIFQTQDESGEPRSMISMYTPNWFRFQYLEEILDSSLADIRYFWTDGALKLEMGGEEVIDLIKALFAESEHRRKAIAEIRRTSMH